jgi:putative membrane protein
MKGGGSMKRRIKLLDHFNWRALLVRFLVNAVALAFTALIVPKITFLGSLGHKFWSVLIVAVGIGLLNALVKPVIQFLMLPFIFASYGLVIVLINTVILYLANFVFPNRFHVSNFGWALLAGAVFGILASLAENLFGLSPPVLEGDVIGREVAQAESAKDFGVRLLTSVTPAGAMPLTVAPTASGEPVQAQPGTVLPETPPSQSAQPADALPPDFDRASSEGREQ